MQRKGTQKVEKGIYEITESGRKILESFDYIVPNLIEHLLKKKPKL